MNSQSITVSPHEAVEALSFEAFQGRWESHDLAANPAVRDVGMAAISCLGVGAEGEPSVIRLTDVTLRDGMQQEINELSTEELVKIFDLVVDTGVDRIEIGHLGNDNGDQALARAIIGHIAEHEELDDRYEKLKLQAFFGSQPDKMEEGLDVLREAFRENYPDTWQDKMAERMIVQVQDRVDENLSSTARVPYDITQAAYRVYSALEMAQQAGFRHFSVGGEGSVARTTEELVQYFRTLTAELVEDGAESVNINLFNTYGYSVHEDWNVGTLAAFNAGVKEGFEDKVTTSIHTHDDMGSATSVSMSAVIAGFDRVEGTLFGMGERRGNQALINWLARGAEYARHEQLKEERRGEDRATSFAAYSGRVAVSRFIAIDPEVVDKLHRWYPNSQAIAEMFGPHALHKFHNTSVGSPYVHENGSGPHDQVMAKGITDPYNHPPDSTYQWSLIINSSFGRDVEAMVLGDPHEVDKHTVGNHAGGSKTMDIKKGRIERADEETIILAKEAFDGRKQDLLRRMRTGFRAMAG
ncbi:MAG TPA: hypothetical protein VFX86_02540 [Candidatus Saccharimonadales bacterium]|nr:hypothetical protein [Candidatus Saccharimonadales bacterium]